MRRVGFVFQGAPGKTVYIAGSFNDWEPEKSPMLYDDAAGYYAIDIDLAPGYYEYKFVVDDLWVLDETNHNFAANDFGTLNSVIEIE